MRKISFEKDLTGMSYYANVNIMRKRYRASNKVKRDSWVRQMAEEMPQLTQKEIAQRFGLEQSTVSRILATPKPELAPSQNASPGVGLSRPGGR